MIYNWLAERAAPHRPLLTGLGYAVSFALLFGGVALHAYRYGFSLAGVAQCGAACAGPGFLAFSAVLCGVGAVLFVVVYATIAEAAQFVLVDPWKHVRPGPPPPEMPVWVVALHMLVGLVVFFAIGAFVEMSPAKLTLGNTWMSVEGPGGKVLTLSGSAMFRMTLGWWIGGAGVLRFFWLRRRAARQKPNSEPMHGTPCADFVAARGRLVQRWRPAITTTDRLLTLNEIRSEVTRIKSRLGGPPVHMGPHYGQSDQDGTPHIEVDDRYHYVVCERGCELERQSTAELDTLLYWIARDLTWSMAFSPHVITHKGGEDSRRTAFRYWVNSIACLDAGWAKRVEAEQADILREHPFVDHPVG